MHSEPDFAYTPKPTYITLFPSLPVSPAPSKSSQPFASYSGRNENRLRYWKAVLLMQTIAKPKCD